MRNDIPVRLLRDIERVLALLAAVGFTAAIGLAAVQPAIGDSAVRPLPTDANESRAPGLQLPAEPAAAAAPRGPELDASLQRIDHAGAHHG
jgi:hypothetical protein